MKNSKIEVLSKGKKEYRHWEKSITMNDKTKSLRVEEVENGFLISISEDGKNEKSGEWEYKTKKYISTKNPLEKLEPMEIKNEDLLEAIGEFTNGF